MMWPKTRLKFFNVYDFYINRNLIVLLPGYFINKKGLSKVHYTGDAQTAFRGMEVRSSRKWRVNFLKMKAQVKCTLLGMLKEHFSLCKDINETTKCILFCILLKLTQIVSLILVVRFTGAHVLRAGRVFLFKVGFQAFFLATWSFIL